MAMLAVSGIGFRAGGRDILRNVSAAVEAGETLALLGPSGCGKTTLLRVIAGLETAASGIVEFDGLDVTSVAAHRRGFGLMFQDHALFPHLDTARNIEFGLKRAGWEAGRRHARVAELLELVGLPGFERRRIDKLSGGERQRVALARALAPDPRLLMLDEPLASLDRGLRERLVNELREILDRLDIPAIYVTHDQAEAFAVADRVAIMDAGEIVRTGTPREAWDDPRTEFVARFLGMDNIVAGTRDGMGWVETAFGRFGPVAGEAGPVRLLLRGEGAEVAEQDGPNVSTGGVTGSKFQGAGTVVELAAGGEAVEFALSPDGDYPVGAEVRVAVGRVQVVAE